MQQLHVNFLEYYHQSIKIYLVDQRFVIVSYVNLHFFFVVGFQRCLVHNNFVDCSENFAGLHSGCKING